MTVAEAVDQVASQGCLNIFGFIYGAAFALAIIHKEIIFRHSNKVADSSMIRTEKRMSDVYARMNP